jgi:hypothetical protein
MIQGVRLQALVCTSRGRDLSSTTRVMQLPCSSLRNASRIDDHLVPHLCRSAAHFRHQSIGSLSQSSAAGIDRHAAADFETCVGTGNIPKASSIGVAGFKMPTLTRLCGDRRQRRFGRSGGLRQRQRLAAGMSGATCGTTREEIDFGYRFHLRAPRFGGLELSSARKSERRRVAHPGDACGVVRITRHERHGMGRTPNWPKTCILWRGSRPQCKLSAHPLSWDGNADSQHQTRYDLSL